MRNGSGTMTVPNTFVASTRVLSADVNENFSDIATEITNSLAADGQTSMTGQFKSYSGVIGAPGVSWASELASGWYRAGSGDFRFSVSGADVFKLTSAGATITGDLTVSGAVTGYMPKSGGTFTGGVAFATGGASLPANSELALGASGAVVSGNVSYGILRGAGLGILFQANTSGTLGTFDNSGNFVASGSVTQFSDERLKSDVSTIDDALALVGRMRGVRFMMTSTGAHGVGVIAQEMQDVVPEVVIESGDRLAVAYGSLAGVFIEAIKDLTARIEALEARP